MVAVVLLALVAAEPQKSPKDALKPLNPLVGSWKGTGYPDGTREERQNGFWIETISWGWQFKGDDARMVATFEKGKHFTRGELRYLADQDKYQFTLTTPAKDEMTFTGTLAAGKGADQILTLERTNPATKEAERFVLRLLHSNRYLYQFETKPAAAAGFTRKYQVGATKEGEPFAQVPKGIECVVSGGKGTIPVSHNGKTYYVCCSGCKDAFKDDPEKFIKEAEKKK
jgi:hypothetical protein